MHTTAEFDTELLKSIDTATDIAVLFDSHLNYVALNDAACRHMKKKEDEVIGQCLLDLYPDVIASTNHRNLLKALNGESILNFRLIGRNGNLFRTSYIPIYPASGNVSGVLVNASPIAE